MCAAVNPAAEIATDSEIKDPSPEAASAAAPVVQAAKKSRKSALDRARDIGYTDSALDEVRGPSNRPLWLLCRSPRFHAPFLLCAERALRGICRRGCGGAVGGCYRQLERERVSQKQELSKLTVREAMAPSFLQLDAGTSVGTAARMMVAAGQDAAVVVDRDAGVMGVACLANVLSTLQESRYAAAAEPPPCGRFSSRGEPNAWGSRRLDGPTSTDGGCVLPDAYVPWKAVPRRRFYGSMRPEGGGCVSDREKAALSILECNALDECVLEDGEENDPEVLVSPVMIFMNESLLTAIVMLEQTENSVLPVCVWSSSAAGNHRSPLAVWWLTCGRWGCRWWMRTIWRWV